MFAKVVLFCAALAAVQASLIAPVGLGAPVLAAGSLGYGKGLIAGVPSVATVSSQKTAINHVAPAAGAAIAAAPIALAGNGILANGVIAGNGILANGLVAGHGIRAAPLAIGNGLLGASYGLGAGYGLGYGAAINTASTQKSVINHVAPVAPRVAVAAAPVVASHGILANGLVGGYGIASNGVVAGNGILSNGLIAGHGIRSAPLALNAGLLGDPVGIGAGYGLGYGAGIVAPSTQKSVINHVAPVAPRVAVAAAPVVSSHGILANGYGIASNGVLGGNGILANGVAPLGLAGHGIVARPLAIGTGLVGAPLGLGLGKAIH